MSWMFHPITLWLVATRLSGWMISSPGFTEIDTPQLTRAYLVIWFSVLLLPLIQPAAVEISTLPDLALAMISEFSIGAGYGLVLRMIFSAIEFGGTLIDSELGYLAGQQFNPFLPISSGIFSRLFFMVAMLYFWLQDYFRVVVAAIQQSFILIPLGSLSQPSFDLTFMIEVGSAMFIGGITLAAPIIAVNFFVNIAIAFLARAVQGLNIFSETFSIKVILGLLSVQFFLQLIFRLVGLEMEQLIPLSSKYFKLVVTHNS